MNRSCIFCQKEVVVADRVGRTESCLHCGRDLHCCLQCKFYDAHAYHECHEPNVDFVSDKEKANFCDYFVFDPQTTTKVSPDESQSSKAKLASLFKK